MVNSLFSSPAAMRCRQSRLKQIFTSSQVHGVAFEYFSALGLAHPRGVLLELGDVLDPHVKGFARVAGVSLVVRRNQEQRHLRAENLLDLGQPTLKCARLITRVGIFAFRDSCARISANSSEVPL